MKLPQLYLRDLFWLVALVAMGCGWWVERTGKKHAESIAADSMGQLESAKQWFAHRGYYVSPDWGWIAEPGTYQLVCRKCGAKFEPDDNEHYGDLCERAEEAGWTGDLAADWVLCDKCSKATTQP
jgi:hypothetical protein